MADPMDATKQCHFVHVRIWCQGKLEDNLWLYPWLSETRERKGVAEIGEVMNRLVVDISPDRFTYSVFGPKRAIREPILRPIGTSPCNSRICLIAAVTR
jgi:hypothetical protein